jgi:transposase
MLSAVQVAMMFGVNEQMVRRMAEEWQDTGGSKGLRGAKIGKCWRFRREDVLAYLEHRFRLAAAGAETLLKIS